MEPPSPTEVDPKKPLTLIDELSISTLPTRDRSTTWAFRVRLLAHFLSFLFSLLTFSSFPSIRSSKRRSFGPSGLNIGIYREAAEHLLTALSLHQTSQQNGGGPELLSKDEAVNQSQNLWSTLRRAFFAMVSQTQSPLEEERDERTGADLVFFSLAGPT